LLVVVNKAGRLQCRAFLFRSVLIESDLKAGST